MEIITNLKEKFKTLSKKQVAIIAGCTLVVVCGGVYGITTLATGNDARSSSTGVTMMGTSAYMEETVSTGDIVVGISETGTASMYQEEISYDFSVEVEEFYVKAGEDVVEGQALALLDMDAVNELKDALALEIADAITALADAEADYDLQAIKATETLSQTLHYGENAEYYYNLALLEIEDKYADLVETAEDLEMDWAETYYELNYELYDDYNLDTLKSNRSTAETNYNTAQTNLSTAQSALEALVTNTTLQTGLKAMSSTKFGYLMEDVQKSIDTTVTSTGSNDTVSSIGEAYWSASSFQNVYGFELNATVYAALVTLYNTSSDWSIIETYYTSLAAYNTASSAYTAAQTAYSTAYSSYSNASDQMEDSLDTLTDQITDAYEAVDDYEYNMPLLRIAAAADNETILANYAAAYDVYDNTMAMNANLVETAEQALETLQTEYEAYDELPADGIVLATCSGYVMRLADTGTEYNAGVALVTIGSDQSVEIWVSISQDDIADISIGMETNVIFDAYEEYTIPAVVESISTSSSSGMTSTVNYTMEIICDISDYPELVVFDSMSATVTFVQRQESGVIMVSSKCVTTEDGISYVKMLDDNGNITQVEVETGFSDGFDVEIVSGLAVGDVVIIESAVG